MQTISFYIVVHSPAIINFFETSKKYEKLLNYKYLLVGNHEEDFSFNNKIIQCNKLTDNIEHNNYYLAYTGWYALAKNIKVDTDFICFLEYDTDLLEDFNLDEFTRQIIDKNLNSCGLTYMPITAGIFETSQFTLKTLEYLRDNNIKEITPNNKNWMTTNNMIFKTSFLYEYFNDSFLLNFFKFLQNDKMSGHFLERFLSIFCFLKNIKFDIIEKSGLQHRGYDSHQTQNIYNSQRGYEQFKTVNKISE
jgi:hypothetical protein